jgi:flavin reductase (DIM6/NTAB) family NADH-FMN oxidoreductase RutF
MHFHADDLAGLATRYRAALVNSLTGFKSANLVGTADERGRTNLAIMSSAVHLGSHPPLIALVIRPDPVERHTLANLLHSGCYTLNHVRAEWLEAAHQTAARYPREQSEFAATGLSEGWWPDFPAPFVCEANIRMGLRLCEHQELAINRTHLVIGEVEQLELPGECLREDGSLDIEAAGSIALSGLDSYHATRRLRRLAYAKPDRSPAVLEGAAD